jgi:hypothetical protein
LGETLAELPLTADQVGLFKAQPGRPKVPSAALTDLAAATVEFRAVCAAATIILKQHRSASWPLSAGRAFVMYRLFGAAVSWISRKVVNGKRTP